MIRLEDIAHYLVTIRHAMAEDIQPDLRSGHVKAKAASIITILDRVVTALKTGDSVAAPRAEEWEAIRQDLQQLGVAPLAAPTQVKTGFLSAMQSVGAGINEMQRALSTKGAVDALAAKLRAHDPRAEAWFARTAAALRDFAEASDPQVPRRPAGAVSAGAPADESERQRTALAAYLHRRFPTLPADAVTEFRITPGGHVKQTALFTLAPNDVLPTRLVLRRDLPNSITGTSVVDEFPLIERAFSIGLPVPKPVLVEPDASILDGCFLIMTEITDSVPAGTYFPEERALAPRMMGPDFGKEVAQVLARLHSATRTNSLNSGADRAEQVRKSYASWSALTRQPYALASEMAYAWLLSHPLPPNRPHCLTHGDVGAHNMMVRDGHLASLLDWELAHPGDPAEDLAQCRMMLLPDVMPWEDFVREYVAAGGDPEACEPNAVAHYCIWTYLKHGLMNATLRQIYLSGERDDVIAASVSGHYYYRLVVQYQARALQIAVEAARAK